MRRTDCRDDVDDGLNPDPARGVTQWSNSYVLHTTRRCRSTDDRRDEHDILDAARVLTHVPVTTLLECATTRDVLALVVGQSLATSALGVAVGLIAALLSTRAMRGLLYGTAATDAPTYLVVATMLIGASVFAAVVPARRATRIDPLEALRRD